MERKCVRPDMKTQQTPFNLHLNMKRGCYTKNLKKAYDNYPLLFCGGIEQSVVIGKNHTTWLGSKAFVELILASSDRFKFADAHKFQPHKLE